ncbi:hypothetical protein ACOSP7_030292 [Xanthoceras sorbifolium]
MNPPEQNQNQQNQHQNQPQAGGHQSLVNFEPENLGFQRWNDWNMKNDPCKAHLHTLPTVPWWKSRLPAEVFKVKLLYRAYSHIAIQLRPGRVLDDGLGYN